jgi:hypothetical protein
VFDKSTAKDSTFSRSDFTYDHQGDCYVCPAESDPAAPNWRDAEGLIRYWATMRDCGPCPLEERCCPEHAARKVLRSVHEGTRELARSISETDVYVVSRRERNKVKMLFADLKRILRLDRLRLRGPCGARDEFHLAAAAQNLRKLVKLLAMTVP